MKLCCISLLPIILLVDSLTQAADFDGPSPIQKRLDYLRVQGTSVKTRTTPRVLCTRCVTIDMVFHIIGTSDSNAARLWTDTAIQEEVKRVNQHFAVTPFRFSSVPRIVRTTNKVWGQASIGSASTREEIVESLRFGGADVVNIFVTDGTCKTTGGYGTYPHDHGFFPPNQYSKRDYIFICATDLGHMYDDVYQTLITHELGHWLGLLHTFEGDSCNPLNEGDGVDDTPQHLENSDDASCGEKINSCPSLPGLDPVSNFMNYASCRNQFTPGQIDRMYSQFNTYRRRLEKCSPNEIDAVFEVRFGSNPGVMEVAYAVYLDEEVDWTTLKDYGSSSNVDYANQVFQRKLCLVKETLYSFTVRDTAVEGFDLQGYAFLSMNGEEVFRFTNLDREWTTTFVLPDTCGSTETRLVVDFDLRGNENEISWQIRTMGSGVMVVERDVTTAIVAKAYRRLHYEKCLEPGDYEFTIYDSGKDGMYGLYSLTLDGETIKSGGGRNGFLTSERTSFQVKPSVSMVACFAGSNSVNVQGKGTIDMQFLEIGDYVEVGEGIFEPVYSFGHFDPRARTRMLQVQASAFILQLSDLHIVFTKHNGPVPAGLLEVGDEILDSQGNAIKVESVSQVESHGAFAPFTPSGRLVVGGISVSSFIAMEPSPTLTLGPFALTYQWLAHTFEFPYRLYCGSKGCRGETYDKHGINRRIPLDTTLWLMKNSNNPMSRLTMFVVLIVLTIFHCAHQLLAFLNWLRLWIC